jgi:hypothetical protein
MQEPAKPSEQADRSLEEGGGKGYRPASQADLVAVRASAGRFT